MQYVKVVTKTLFNKSSKYYQLIISFTYYKSAFSNSKIQQKCQFKQILSKQFFFVIAFVYYLLQLSPLIFIVSFFIIKRNHFTFVQVLNYTITFDDCLPKCCHYNTLGHLCT